MRTEMEQCCNYARDGDVCTISCKLGLWSVSGPYGLALIDEATHYFHQYKSDGEYSSLIGGPTVVEVFSKSK
jgi:hypothetical protein